MTDKRRQLAELETQYRELMKKRDRLDFARDADMVSGYTLHRLLKSMASLESQIDDLQRDLNGRQGINEEVTNYAATNCAPDQGTPLNGAVTKSL